MGNISYWGQTKDINIIKKGLEDYLKKAKDIVRDFTEDLQGNNLQLECISNEDYYLFIVNLIDIFNGEDYAEFMELENVEDLPLTEKGEKIYNFIKVNYNYFNDLDIRLSIDNNAEYDIEKYKPNVYDYIIISGLNEIIK